MSYLVTGGTGFIGAYIVRLLAQEGEQVIAFDVNPARDLLDYLLDKQESDQVDIVRGNITDLAHLIRTAQEYHVERIIHLAAMLSVASAANPPLAVRVNCGGTVNVLETARILSLKKVVLASSASVFGPPEMYEEEYLPNDAPHYPSGIYGACKSFTEQLANYYFNEYGVDTIAIRFPAVYGMGQKEGASAIFTEELMVKPVLGKPGSVPYGDSIFNWLYVDDAARATVMASKADTTKTRAFNLSGDVRQTTEVVDCARKLIPNAEINILPGHVGIAAKYNTTQIEEEIGFHYQWPIERGIKKVIDEVRQQHSPR